VQHFEPPTTQLVGHEDGVHEEGVMHAPPPSGSDWQQVQDVHAAPPVPQLNE
jgi:hypothetical protein